MKRVFMGYSEIPSLKDFAAILSNPSATEEGFLGFRVPLTWHVSSRIGRAAIYVQNLNINTQIVHGPLQALLSLTHPLAIWKQISE